jgi:hypothetical protein
MNRFEQYEAMNHERTVAAAMYYRLREAGRHAEAEPYRLRALALSKELSALVKSLRSTEPGGYLYKQRQERQRRTADKPMPPS